MLAQVQQTRRSGIRGLVRIRLTDSFSEGGALSMRAHANELREISPSCDLPAILGIQLFPPIVMRSAARLRYLCWKIPAAF